MDKQNPYLHDIGRQFVKNHLRKTVTEEDHLMEAAQEFGRLVAHGEKTGLSVPVAFEAAREHFKRHGKAMMQLADAITLEAVNLKRK